MDGSSQSTQRVCQETYALDPATDFAQIVGAQHRARDLCSSITAVPIQKSATYCEHPEFNPLPTFQEPQTSQDDNKPPLHPAGLISNSDGALSPEYDSNRDAINPATPTTPFFTAREEMGQPDELFQASENIFSLPDRHSPLAISNSVDSMDAAQGSSISKTIMAASTIDRNILQPKACKPGLTSALLINSEDPKFSQYTLHVPSGFNSLSPEVEEPYLNYGVLQVAPLLTSGHKSLLNPSDSNVLEEYLHHDPESTLSSPALSSSGRTQYSNIHPQRPPHMKATNVTTYQGPQPNLSPLYPHEACLSSTLPSPHHVVQSIEIRADEFTGDAVDETTQPTAGPKTDYEEQELSPLEYARKNGLSRNYLKEPYSISDLTMLASYQSGLIDDSHLHQLTIAADINTDERLMVSKEAARLLSSVTRAAVEDTLDWYDSQINMIIRSIKSKMPKQELPLLRSDHETDCKAFAEREGFETKLEDVKLPLEVVDEANNGGVTFLPALWNKSTEILGSLQRERLEVSKDTLNYLQEILRDDWTEEDEKKLWATSPKKYRRNKALEHVTPPLSPLLFPTQLYEPSLSDPAFELPILSDPESLTKQDLEDIEKRIFNEDIPTPLRQARTKRDASSDTLAGSDTVNLADIYSPAASLDRPSGSPVRTSKRVRREDLRVEEPLTPEQPQEPQKFVRFSQSISEWPAVSRSPSRDPLDSAFFEEAFGEAHTRATRMSEQESLIAADTTARVKVPDVDFSLPIPPWETVRDNNKSSLLREIQRSIIEDNVGKSPPKWSGLSKADVRWNPFPHDLAKVALDERCFEDDATWELIVNGPGDDDIIDTSALTWKPAGLRLLKDDDEDDEIEPAQFEKRVAQDISFLAKKRRLEIEERDSGGESIARRSPCDSSARQPPRKKTPGPNEFLAAALSHSATAGASLLMGGAFSVGNSVDNFLELRGTKPKLSDSSYFAKASDLSKGLVVAKNNPQPENFMQLPIPNSPAPRHQSPLPAPFTKVPTSTVKVIVASQFLKHRSLIKHIETLFPGVILVERDFSAHDRTAWMPGAVTRSPIVSPLASEADIIVSPLVGIIITSLQKIKQKPLPGQKARSAIRERLEKVSPRYGRLVVLVTEKRADEEARDFDASDCNAFIEFVGFATGLESSVDVRFLGGGEATLAKWIVNVIVQHQTDLELLADETHWELFLRRAGLNAFAAQHIIGVLKAPGSTDIPSPSKLGHYGLTAFVQMGGEQRVSLFGPMCGHTLMARVSAVIDASWF